MDQQTEQEQVSTKRNISIAIIRQRFRITIIYIYLYTSMKTSDQQPDQSNQKPFNRQTQAISPNHKNNPNCLNTDYTNKPLISKLQINFPKIKICESRKDVTQEFLDKSDKSITMDHSYFPFGTNPLNKQYPLQHKFNHYQLKSPNLTTQQYTNRRQRSPLRYNEYSYQQTTKEDSSQHNTPSYHDFFKVPIQLHHPQIPSSYPVSQSQKDIQTRQTTSPSRKIDIFSIQSQQNYKLTQKSEQNNQIYTFQPMLNSLKSKQQLIQTPIKQKGNLTLSQLLSDLQKKSEKLYQIYGQNNQNYQKCLETIDKNQNSLLQKPTFVQELRNDNFKISSNPLKMPETTFLYTDSKTDQYDSWKNLQSHKQSDLHKKSFDSTKQQYLNTKQPTLQKQKIHSTQIKDFQFAEKIPYNKNPHQHTTFTPVKQKSSFIDDKQYQSADKKMMNSLQNFHSNTKGIISTSKYFTKQSSIIDKKKKVMFFHEQNTDQISSQKTSQFVYKLKRFFNKLLLDYLKAHFFYQTGVLSTESNIHATSGRNTEELMADKSKESNKETSFFQDYFQKKDKNMAEIIVCNMMGGTKNNKISNAEKTKAQDILTPYALLPIQEQLQSSYGLSIMGKSQQKKSYALQQRQSNFNERQEQKGSKRKDCETDSIFKDHVNTNESRKVEELLIYSVDKNFLKNNLGAKKQAQFPGRRRQIDLQRFSIGLDKIAELMKYKVLTQVRYGYLSLKFINPHYTEKSGISSLKISQAGKNSTEQFEKIPDVPTTPRQSKEQQQMISQSVNSHRLLSENFALKTQNIQSMGIGQKRKEPQQPRNILEHYYKKSSPNSQTNEYSSIIEEKQMSPSRNRIISGHERINSNHQINGHFIEQRSPNQITNEFKRSQFFNNQHKQIQQLQYQLSPHNSHQNSSRPNSLKKSQLISYHKIPQSPEVIKQDYYGIGSIPQYSKMSRQRTSRALSSASSKVHGNSENNVQERITKESLLNMRRSELAIFSASSTGNNFNHNLHQKEQVNSLTKQSQIMNKEIYLLVNHQLPVGNNTTSTVKNCHTIQNYRLNNPLHTLRPLQPQQKQLDYYNSRGKICRSYSQRDFKNHFNQTQNKLNTLRPIDTLHTNPINHGNHVKIDPEGITKQIANNLIHSSSRDDIRRSSIHQIQPNTLKSIKSSAIINSQMKNSNILSHHYPPAAMINHTKQMISQSAIPNMPNLTYHNSQMIANIPAPHSRTIRPIFNPSIQKRRSQSLSSLLHTPSLHGINPSNTPSMLKELQGKPYIQFKHQNSPTQHHTIPHMQMNQGMHGQNQFAGNHKISSISSRVQNRPRVSKSMDQCTFGSSGLCQYNMVNSAVGGYQCLGNSIPPSLQQAIRPESHFRPPNISLVLRPTKTLQKQVDVNNEYHMLKNNQNLAGTGHSPNLMINPVNSPLSNGQIKRNNELMQYNNNMNGKGSRVKYDEQNLIIKSNNHNQHSPNMNNSNYQHLSPQHIPNHQMQHQRIQFPSPSTTLKSPNNASVKASTVFMDQMGAGNIPKPKSPSLIPKARSPQAGRTKIFTPKLKQGRLSNYGQN